MLLALLLAALLALLATHDELRQPAKATAGAAIRDLVFDRLGFSPRQVYRWRLRIAGLYDRPLGRCWRSAVARAAADPGVFTRDYASDGHFAADRVSARIFQFALARGETFAWRLKRRGNGRTRLYASLKRRTSADRDEWTTVTDIAADGQTHRRVISQDSEYRIVLQPELFGAVDYRIAMAIGGSLAFPVRGASNQDIGSSFGAPRDGGTRAHHGVDIFAARGTPVTAVVAGRVRTGTEGIGGNHVWLSGGVLGVGGNRYYYAHLDSVAVESGDRVDAGQVIGHVGNTGNARTTPPHLHFGIYTAGGAIDPAPFLEPPPRLPTAG